MDVCKYLGPGVNMVLWWVSVSAGVHGLKELEDGCL